MEITKLNIEKPIYFPTSSSGKNPMYRENSNFYVIKFILDPIKDQKKIENWYEKAQGMNANIKNTNGDIREEQNLIKDRYLGVASEELFTLFLQQNFPEYKVSNPEFENYETHVDIIIEKNSNLKKTIELRSSFPRAKLNNVIWYYFDLIGPYVTKYKKFENSKDFYARAFINIAKEDFDINKVHNIYLVGGASFEEIKSKGTEQTFDTTANYLTIKPMADANDIDEFLNLLRVSLC